MSCVWLPLPSKKPGTASLFFPSFIRGPLDEFSCSGLSRKSHLPWCKRKNTRALRGCAEEPAPLLECCSPQQSTWMGLRSQIPTDMSINQELTPGLRLSWKPRVGPVLAVLLPAGCCRYELGQTFIPGRLSSPLQPWGLMICGRRPGRGGRGSCYSTMGRKGAKDAPCHRAENR